MITVLHFFGLTFHVEKRIILLRNSDNYSFMLRVTLLTYCWVTPLPNQNFHAVHQKPEGWGGIWRASWKPYPFSDRHLRFSSDLFHTRSSFDCMVRTTSAVHSTPVYVPPPFPSRTGNRPQLQGWPFQNPTQIHTKYTQRMARGHKSHPISDENCSKTLPFAVPHIPTVYSPYKTIPPPPGQKWHFYGSFGLAVNILARLRHCKTQTLAPSNSPDMQDKTSSICTVTSEIFENACSNWLSKIATDKRRSKYGPWSSVAIELNYLSDHHLLKGTPIIHN